MTTDNGSGAPRRVSRTDIMGGRIWDLGAAFEIESDRIESWLKSRAHQEARANNATKESTLAAGVPVVNLLAGHFSELPIAVDRAELQKAELGDLKKEAGSGAVNNLLLALAIGAALLEFIVFYLQFSRGQIGFLAMLFQAAFLSIAGWLLGHGLGTRYSENYSDGGTGSDRQEVIFSLIGGLVGIFTVGIFRVVLAYDENMPIWELLAPVAWTTVISVIIAMTSAIWILRRDRYRNRLDRQFNAQLFVASHRHQKAQATDVWKDSYNREVESIFREK